MCSGPGRARRVNIPRCAVDNSIHQASFAVTSNGQLLLNVLELDAKETLQRLMDTAAAHRGAVFVGIALTRAEAHRVLADTAHGHREAAAHIGGVRIRRKRVRRKR